ncbi:MAG: hypothetical protein ACLFNO_01580 [Parcubacteria group bacterium]
MYKNISKEKKKILLLSILVFFIVLTLSLLFNLHKEGKTEKKIKNNELKIAACPTYSELLLLKQDNWYNVLSTRSTAESLTLLNKNLVDYVVSGRPPKPLESDYKYFYVNKSGYSFLGDSSVSYYLDDLKDMKIYTDLKDVDVEFLEGDLKLNNIIKVDDVYNRDDNSLAITTWENTDYSKDSIVHIYNKNNNRYELSRTPIIYCKNCDQEVINLLIKTLNN